MMDDFAIFILTHGRPYNQRTLEALANSGYTGEYYLVIDNLDTAREDYYRLYGNRVLEFDKTEYVKKTDTGLTNPWINFAVFARNAIEDIAKKLGFRFFGMFDDDLLKFRFRYFENDMLLSLPVVNLDKVISSYLEFMETANIACSCFGVSNNFIGGKKNVKLYTPSSNSFRLCFNSYIRNAKFDVSWAPNMCEDRITSIFHNMRGQVWQQLLFVQVDMAPLYGEIDGGNSFVYRSLDDFTKVFFPVVTNPGSNCICEWKNRFITQVKDDAICGKIVSGRYKK